MLYNKLYGIYPESLNYLQQSQVYKKTTCK